MRSMHHPALPIDCTSALLRIGAAGAWAGRTVLLGRTAMYLLAVTLLSALWNLVAAERLPDTLAGQLPAGGFAVYIGVTEWILLSVPSIHLRLEDDIRSGAVEAHLLRPVPYPLLRVAESCGGLLVRQTTLGVAGLVLLLLSGHTAPSLAVWPALVLLGVLGGLVGILLHALVGMSAFWVRRTTPIYLCVQKMSFLLGGLLAPVTLYPTWLRHAAEASPFAAQLYWPAAVVIAPGMVTVSRALMLQALWLTILALLLAVIWRLGLNQLLRQGM